MRFITLTKGLATILSDRDYCRFKRFPWYAQRAGLYYYAARRDGKKIILLHREILEAKPNEVVDHRNLNGLHNNRRNLRRASHSQNHGNAPKIRRKCHSQFKGVCWTRVNKRNPWIAYVNCAGKREYLGYFPDEVKAALAYNRRARQLFKSFARLNQV